MLHVLLFIPYLNMLHPCQEVRLFLTNATTLRFFFKKLRCYFSRYAEVGHGCTNHICVGKPRSPYPS